MDIAHVNSQSLLRLLSLAERKEELLQLIDEIDSAIINTLKGGAVSVEVFEVTTTSKPAIVELKPARQPAAAATPSKPSKKTGRSGGLKDRILALLEEAGSEGLRVKEIADKLGVKATNISVWFSTTGKKFTTKVEPGRFAALGSKPSFARPSQTDSSIKPLNPAKKSKMSPEARARIGAAAKARWSARRIGAPTVVAPAEKPIKAAKPARKGISPEGLAKIAAAAKARWAKVRASKAETKPAGAAKKAKKAKPTKFAKA